MITDSCIHVIWLQLQVDACHRKARMVPMNLKFWTIELSMTEAEIEQGLKELVAQDKISILDGEPSLIYLKQ